MYSVCIHWKTDCNIIELEVELYFLTLSVVSNLTFFVAVVPQKLNTQLDQMYRFY